MRRVIVTLAVLALAVQPVVAGRDHNDIAAGVTIPVEYDFSEYALLGDTVLVCWTGILEKDIGVQAIRVPQGDLLWSHRIDGKMVNIFPVRCTECNHSNEYYEYYDSAYAPFFKGSPGLVFVGEESDTYVNLHTGNSVTVSTAGSTRSWVIGNTYVQGNLDDKKSWFRSTEMTTGAELWKTELRGPLHVAARIGGEFSDLRSKSTAPECLVLEDEKTSLYTLNLVTGELIQCAKELNRWFDRTLEYNGNVVGLVIEKDPMTIIAYDPIGGKMLWNLQFPRGARAEDPGDPVWVVDDSCLLIGTDNIHAVSLTTGREPFTVTLKGTKGPVEVASGLDRLFLQCLRDPSDNELLAAVVDKSTGEIVSSCEYKLRSDADTLVPLRLGYSNAIQGLLLSSGWIVLEAEKLHGLPLNEGAHPWVTKGAGTVLDIAHDNVLTMSEGRVLCVDVSDGFLRWKSPKKADSEVLFGDSIIVARFGKQVVGLDRTSGSELWRSEGKTDCDPIFAEDVVVSVFDKEIRGLSARTGEVRWKSSRFVSGKLVGASGGTMLAPMDSHLVALRYADGSTLWESQDVFGKGLRVLGYDDNIILLYDPGKMEYKGLFGDLIGKGRWTGGIYCLDMSTGQTRWRFQQGKAPEPTGIDSLVVYASDDSRTWIISIATGEYAGKRFKDPDPGLNMGKDWLALVNVEGKRVWKVDQSVSSGCWRSDSPAPGIDYILAFDKDEYRIADVPIVDLTTLLVPVHNKALFGMKTSNAIVAISADKGEEQWRLLLPDEPRAIVVPKSRKFWTVACLNREVLVIPSGL